MCLSARLSTSVKVIEERKVYLPTLLLCLCLTVKTCLPPTDTVPPSVRPKLPGLCLLVRPSICLAFEVERGSVCLSVCLSEKKLSWTLPGDYLADHLSCPSTD